MSTLTSMPKAVSAAAGTGRSPGAAGPTSRSCLPESVCRRARLAALAAGCFLLPWCVVLGFALPASARVGNWSLAWAGLDAAEGAMALATAILLTRHDRRASLTAAAGAALLLLDAWFDVCTSAPGLSQLLAMSEAACVELPLAAAAIWLAIALTRYSR